MDNTFNTGDYNQTKFFFLHPVYNAHNIIITERKGLVSGGNEGHLNAAGVCVILIIVLVIQRNTEALY